MADYTAVPITLNGVAPTINNAAAGDKILAPGDRKWLNVANGAGASMTLTITPSGNTDYGVAKPAKVITIPATSQKNIPVFAEYGDPADSGKVTLVWSSTTTVTWSYLTI